MTAQPLDTDAIDAISDQNSVDEVVPLYELEAWIERKVGEVDTLVAEVRRLWAENAAARHAVLLASKLLQSRNGIDISQAIDVLEEFMRERRDKDEPDYGGTP